jgi:hypothetical protein
MILRFRHHQLGINIDAHIDGAQWQTVDLVPARNFVTIEEQWAYPSQYVAALRRKGYAVTVSH